MLVLRRVNPLAKAAMCLLWIAAASLIFDVRFQLATIALAAGALILVDRTPVWMVLAVMVPFALFGFGFLTTGVLFRQDGGYVTALSAEAALSSDAAAAGVVLFFRAIACGMASFLFVRTTDPDALVRSAMVHARLPARIGYALFTALHLVPDLLAEMRQIRLARAMRRGRPPSRLIGPVEAASLVIPLLATAIRRATRSAIAMEARGLTPRRKPSLTNVPGFGAVDAAFLLAAGGALIVCIFALGFA